MRIVFLLVLTLGAVGCRKTVREADATPSAPADRAVAGYAVS